MKRATERATVTMPGCRETAAARRAKNPSGSLSAAAFMWSGQKR